MNENELLLAIGKMLDEKLDTALEPIKKELASNGKELSSLRKDVSSLKDDMLEVKDDISAIKEDVTSLKSQVQENTLILRALREHSEINKAEHDTMKLDIAHIKGDIVEIKENAEALKRTVTTIEAATSLNWNEIAALKLAQ